MHLPHEPEFNKVYITCAADVKLNYKIYKSCIKYQKHSCGHKNDDYDLQLLYYNRRLIFTH